MVVISRFASGRGKAQTDADCKKSESMTIGGKNFDSSATLMF